MTRISRRGMLLAGGGALALGTGLALRPSDNGRGGHNAYFAGISSALKRAGIAQPTLMIDRQRLDANIRVVRGALSPTPLGLRIVTKSLQAPALLDRVVAGTHASGLMVFNGVMLDAIARRYPASDVLLGRPLPAVQVDEFLRARAGDASLASDPQWLVDSAERFHEYLAIAEARGRTIRVNLEIDVGLHRGGVPDASTLASLVDLARAQKSVTITGLMGYDAQVMGVPFRDSELAHVKAKYQAARDVLREKLNADPGRLTLNTAGSPTYRLHLDDKIANEVAIGSGFVKPLDFDLDTLSEHVPAAFIAEPVLKAMDQALIPTLERFSGVLDLVDPNSRQAFFAYGGYGDAEPVSPEGLEFSSLYGGRAMLTGSRRVILHQDDFIFFRPRESEGTFLQFGDIAVYDGGEIAERWPTFAVAA